MQCYEIIKADSPEEAVKKSQWSIGALARCVEVEPVANGDGTWSVFPSFAPAKENALTPDVREEDDCA